MDLKLRAWKNLPCLYHQKRSASRVQHSLTSAVYLLKGVLRPIRSLSFGLFHSVTLVVETTRVALHLSFPLLHFL